MFISQDISDTERTALSAVSYVGCGISIVCLLITIIALVYYRLVASYVCSCLCTVGSHIHIYIYIINCILCNCRNTLLEGIHNFIHLNLAIALTLALIVFVSGIETATDSEVSKCMCRV